MHASGEGGGNPDGGDKLKRVGEWIMGETLGQGSFGKVKLAHHAKTKEKVAIKIVDKAGIANVEDVERVYRETFILTTLKHVNIIKVSCGTGRQTCRGRVTLSRYAHSVFLHTASACSCLRCSTRRRAFCW